MKTYKITFEGFVLCQGLGKFSWKSPIIAENEEKAKDKFWADFVKENPIGCEIGSITATEII